MNRDLPDGFVVPVQVKQPIGDALRPLRDDVAHNQGSCLFVIGNEGEYCGEPVSERRHIISNAKVLGKLKDADGMVLQFEWGVSQWSHLLLANDEEHPVQLLNPATFQPFRVSPDDACIGRFACQQYAHDNKFQLIDVEEPDFDDPVARLLSAYRLKLFQVDQCRRALSLIRKWDPLVMKRPNRMPFDMWYHNQQIWRKETQQIHDALATLDPTAKLLGRSWHAKETTGILNADLVSSRVLEFRSKLGFAGGAFYGRHTAISVFPTQGDCNKMAVFYLANQAEEVAEDIERLTEVAESSTKSDDYSVTVIRELMEKGWGALAVSPASYDGLDEHERSTIQRLVANHSVIANLVRSVFQQSAGSKPRRSK